MTKKEQQIVKQLQDQIKELHEKVSNKEAAMAELRSNREAFLEFLGIDLLIDDKIEEVKTDIMSECESMVDELTISR